MANHEDEEWVYPPAERIRYARLIGGPFCGERRVVRNPEPIDELYLHTETQCHHYVLTPSLEGIRYVHTAVYSLREGL
jgi:hypothetical protein